MRPAFIGIVAAMATGIALSSFAHGDAAHAHKPQPQAAAGAPDTPYGRQGDPRKVARTITIDMSDNMRFTPAALTVARGETVRLKVANRGQVMHELVLGTDEAIRQHSEAMKQHPGMAHDAPNMVHVAPGKTGEVVWQFTQPGEFRFACLLPGHFEAGMTGKVTVR